MVFEGWEFLLPILKSLFLTCISALCGDRSPPTTLVLVATSEHCICARGAQLSKPTKAGEAASITEFESRKLKAGPAPLPLQSLDMPLINRSFQRLPERKKWFWRVLMIFCASLNVWERFHDVALGRTFFAIGDAVFVFLILCVIVGSFLGRGKSAIQGG